MGSPDRRPGLLASGSSPGPRGRSRGGRAARAAASSQAQRGRRSPRTASPTLPGLTNRTPPACAPGRVGVAADDAVGAEIRDEAGEVPCRRCSRRSRRGGRRGCRASRTVAQPSGTRTTRGSPEEAQVLLAELVGGPGARADARGLRVVGVAAGAGRPCGRCCPSRRASRAADLGDARLGVVAAHHQVAREDAGSEARPADVGEHGAQRGRVGVDVAEQGEPLSRHRCPARPRGAGGSARPSAAATRP